MHQQLLKSEHYVDIVNLMRLPGINSTSTSIVKKSYLLKAILSNACLVDSFRNWSRTLFSEAFYIKALASKVNDGSKASHKLILFKLYHSSFIMALKFDSNFFILAFQLISFSKIFYL